MIDYYFGAEPDDIKLIECFRGLGKSQLSMEFSLYCLCESIDDYVLLVGSTQDLTNDLVTSCSLMLEDTVIPNAKVHRAVEGILEIDRGNGDICYLVAKSTGSKLRGVAKGKKRHRPSRIVLDDISSDDLVANRVRMARANRWIASALLPTLRPGGIVIGSGTPQHKSDPFMSLVGVYGSLKIPISIAAWPDRFDENWITRKKEQFNKLGQMRSWKQEFDLVLTDAESQLFDMNKITYATEIPEDTVCFMTCDLAFSEKSGADYSGLIVNGVDEQGNWFIYPVAGRWKPSETAGKIFELVNKFNILDVGIEAGASMIAVKEHLDELMLQYQSYFNIIELKHGGKSKISRVSALEPVVQMGRLHIVDNGDAAEMLIEQMELTDSLTIASGNDDLIDALAYQLDMNARYYVDHGEYSREEYEDALYGD